MFSKIVISSKDITLDDVKTFYNQINFEFNYSTLINLYNLVKHEIAYIKPSEKDFLYFNEVGMLYTSDELLFKAVQLGDE